ncbi:MAG: hypothetical protein LUD29_00455 [Clostridia bacterium]|nr:hypothetical protein [Clostridia bacterium]
MPGEYNDPNIRETNTTANETSNIIETVRNAAEADTETESPAEAAEFGTSTAGGAAPSGNDNNNDNTQQVMNQLSGLSGGATAAISGAFASVVAVVAAVTVLPAAATTPLTAEFVSLTSVVSEQDTTDICYSLELGSTDEEFEVTPDLYPYITISLTNRYTDRTYTLEEMGGLTGRFEDVKDGTKYSVSLEYDGCLVLQEYITTDPGPGPSIDVVYRCRCSIDGTFHLQFFFGGDVSAFTNFSASLTDTYGNVSTWTPGDDFCDEWGNVLYRDVDFENDDYTDYFGEDEEVYAEEVEKRQEAGFKYVTEVQKIKVTGALGGSFADLTITYDVYGVTYSLEVLGVGI